MDPKSPFSLFDTCAIDVVLAGDNESAAEPVFKEFNVLLLVLMALNGAATELLAFSP